MINYEDFKKVDLKIVTIESAERVEGSDKLLRLIVQAGDTNAEGLPISRQLISGIGKNYEPDTLIGRQVVIVANLERRSLMGFESNGMVLAASTESGPVLLMPFDQTEPGASIG